VLELTQRLLEAAQGGEPVVVGSVLEAGPTALTPGSRLLVERDGRRTGTLGSPDLDTLFAAHAEGMFARHAAETLYVTEGGLTERTVPGATSIYAEVLESKPAFVVVGAGHIGRSLVKLADFLDFHVVVIDDREEFADRSACRRRTRSSARVRAGPRRPAHQRQHDDRDGHAGPQAG
jgi:xanthine dehydrogenase accessory factor